MNRILCASLIAFSCTAAQAQGPVAVPTTVRYAEGVGTESVRAECEWNTQLITYLAGFTKGRTVVTDAPAADQATLSMTVTGVHTAGGGRWSGAKWGEIKGELRDHGRVLGSFTALRQTTASVGFGACGPLKRVAKSIAQDIAEWLRQPTMDAHLGDSKPARSDD